MASDIIQATPPIKKYHYVVGDGLWENAALKFKDWPPYLRIWHDDDQTDEVAPAVLPNVVYNDEGRGAFPLIQAGYGHLGFPEMAAIANQIATQDGNIMNVVYNPPTFSFAVSYANGASGAFTQPYAYGNLDYFVQDLLPTAAFTASPLSGTAPLTVQFSDN